MLVRSWFSSPCNVSESRKSLVGRSREEQGKCPVTPFLCGAGENQGLKTVRKCDGAVVTGKGAIAGQEAETSPRLEGAAMVLFYSGSPSKPAHPTIPGSRMPRSTRRRSPTASVICSGDQPPLPAPPTSASRARPSKKHLAGRQRSSRWGNSCPEADVLERLGGSKIERRPGDEA